MLKVDMPMPKNCKVCPAKEWGGACAITEQFDPFGGRPSWCSIKGELVLCGKCYYKDEKRIMDEDALWCRKHHMYVTADWFCADGARKIEAGVYVNGEVAFIKGGPEDENESALDETEDVDK